MKNENDIYLSDWLAGNISDDQLKKLVSADDFLAYLKLKKSLDNLTISNPNLEKNFDAIKQKRRNKNVTKPKVLSLWKYTSVAASLVFFIAAYFYFTVQNNFETSFGENKNITLTDNSKVILNSKSQLCYTNFFKFSRNLMLNGEAFFKVEKGSKFTVNTPQGKVEVLGTKFNVNTTSNFFEVICYHGKVKVTFNDKIFILKAGESIRNYNNNVEEWVEKEIKSPTWINQETTFKNTPIKIVFEKINNQYNKQISYPKELENTVFTGVITHKNIDIALQSVCIPLNLKIEKISSNKIEIVHE